MLKFKHYSELSTDNIEKFEKGLIRWSKVEGYESNMLFDQSSLSKICETLRKEGSYLHGIIFSDTDNATIRKMETPNLTIFWDGLSKDKCVLRKIIFKPTAEVLYSATELWKDTVIWYGY